MCQKHDEKGKVLDIKLGPEAYKKNCKCLRILRHKKQWDTFPLLRVMISTDYLLHNEFCVYVKLFTKKTQILDIKIVK